MKLGEHTTCRSHRLTRSRQSTGSRTWRSTYPPPTALTNNSLADQDIDAIYNPAAQPASTSLDHQSRRSRQARPRRKTHRPHRSRSRNPSSRPRPHRRKNRRSLHGPQPPSNGSAFASSSAKAASANYAPSSATSATSTSIPANIRNKVEDIGGGAHHGHRLLPHPRRAIRIRPATQPRRLPHQPRPRNAHRPPDLRASSTSAIPARPSSPAATQLVPYQRLQFFGTKGRIELEIPVNAAPTRPAPCASSSTTAAISPAPASSSKPFLQSTNTRYKAIAFAKAVFNDTEVPVSIRRRHRRTWRSL